MGRQAILLIALLSGVLIAYPTRSLSQIPCPGGSQTINCHFDPRLNAWIVNGSEPRESSPAAAANVDPARDGPLLPAATHNGAQSVTVPFIADEGSSAPRPFSVDIHFPEGVTVTEFQQGANSFRFKASIEYLASLRLQFVLKEGNCGQWSDTYSAPGMLKAHRRDDIGQIPAAHGTPVGHEHQSRKRDHGHFASRPPESVPAGRSGRGSMRPSMGDDASA